MWRHEKKTYNMIENAPYTWQLEGWKIMLQLFHEAEKVLLGETSDYNVVLRLIDTRHSTSRQFDKAEHRLYFWICRILQPAPPLPPPKKKKSVK